MIELAKKWFGEQPLGFVDIGARGGVHSLVEPIATYVDVLAFEPDETACHAVNNAFGPWLRKVCVPVALSNGAKSARLYRCASSTNDSLLPINRAFVDRYNMVKFAPIGMTYIQTEKLDNVLKANGLVEQGEFLKLDTQGTEYEILQGARRTLNERTVAIFCEVEFAQIYEGQNLFSDIDLLLHKHGFSFIGFDNMSYRSRTPWKGRERLLHADALFIKDPLEHTMSERQQQVAAMACLLCGYDDFANEIMETM